MEFDGEPFFKIKAYERAAETVENADPLSADVDLTRLVELPGVGKTIAARIATLARTGTDPYLEELRAKYPATLLEVLGVQGVGMKTAQQLFERLGVASLADLERARRGRARRDAAAGQEIDREHPSRRAGVQGPHAPDPAGGRAPDRARGHRLPGRDDRRADTSPRPAACGGKSRPSATSTSSAPRGTRSRSSRRSPRGNAPKPVLAEGPTKASIWLAGRIADRLARAARASLRQPAAALHRHRASTTSNFVSSPCARTCASARTGSST